MPINLLHQCGHNTIWNIQSFVEDGCGDGLILSPVHSPKDSIEGIDESVRNVSLFDPQYYLPGSQKKKLNTYDFFPEVITGGFATDDFAMHAWKSAQLCVEFQVSHGFKAVIIPTRYIGQMVTNFCEKQNAYTVHPFVDVLTKNPPGVPVYLSIVMTSHMIKDAAYRTNILNWITSFPVIDGVVLIPDCERGIKQVDDVDYLERFLIMLHELRLVGLSVIVGYQNTEGVVASLIEGAEVSFGAFENTRIFSVDKFLETEEQRKGPRARIYLPGLLNWIQLGQAKEIRKRAPDVWEGAYAPTEYSEKALNLAVEPSFNNPALYKHHFLCFSQQVDQLGQLTPIERYTLLRTWMQQAMERYAALEAEHIDLEPHGRGTFLEAWLGAINRYWSTYLKPKN